MKALILVLCSVFMLASSGCAHKTKMGQMAGPVDTGEGKENSTKKFATEKGDYFDSPGTTIQPASESNSPASVPVTFAGGTTPVPAALKVSKASGEQPPELQNIMRMTQRSSTAQDLQVGAELRPKAMREAALVISAQTGMGWRYGKILEEVGKYSATLDKGFNFAPLLIKQENALIMPPVLAESGASMRVEGDTALTSAITTYEMLQDAKYISVVPNWRTYIEMPELQEPEQPHPSLLPRTRDERRLWQEATLEGWAMGVEQADQLFEDNVARLVRDHKGLMVYQKLAAQRMMHQPAAATSSLGTHVANGKMNIDQKVFRITQPAAFNGNDKTWAPIVR